MKNVVVMFILIFGILVSYGQDISLNAKSISPSGINNVNEGVNVSKWRLGEVHTIVISQNFTQQQEEDDWDIRTFPNPFSQTLNIEFSTKKVQEFSISVTDIKGNEVFLKQKMNVIAGQQIGRDLAHLSSAIYLVSVSSKDQSIQKIVKVQKQ